MEKCGRALYAETGVAIMIVVILLVIVGLLVVQPYHHTSTFRLTQCETVNASYPGQWRSCSCGGRTCISSYPCLRVTVNYVISDQRLLGLLHNSDYELAETPEVCIDFYL